MNRWNHFGMNPMKNFPILCRYFSYQLHLVKMMTTITMFFVLLLLQQCTLSQSSPILVLYIPNQSADSEIKTKAGSPRVASYDMMMWLCHDLMIDTLWKGLPFLRQNTKCQRLWGSKGRSSCNVEIWITASPPQNIHRSKTLKTSSY